MQQLYFQDLNWHHAAARRSLRRLAIDEDLPDLWTDLLDQMHGQPSRSDETADAHNCV